LVFWEERIGGVMNRKNENDEDFYKSPKIDLLNKKQWSYVQRE